MFFCILGYSKHIIFSWKSHTFLMIFYVIFGDFVGWDWGTPPYCNKNTLGKIGSKFGIGIPPPPQLGQKAKFFQWVYLKAPLNRSSDSPQWWREARESRRRLSGRWRVSRCQPWRFWQERTWSWSWSGELETPGCQWVPRLRSKSSYCSRSQPTWRGTLAGGPSKPLDQGPPHQELVRQRTHDLPPNSNWERRRSWRVGFPRESGRWRGWSPFVGRIGGLNKLS